MGLAIDWENQIIQVTSPTTQVDMQTLHDFIEDQMSSPVGLNYAAIIAPEGKIEDPTNPGVYSQIIVILHAPWQIQFWGGSGYTRIYGGKLVGGYNDQPVKATGTAGDITILESPVDGLVVISDQSSLLQQADVENIATELWTKDISGITDAGSGAKYLVDNSATLVSVASDISTIETNIAQIESDLTATIAAVMRLLGLNHENHYTDQIVIDSTRLQSCRIRIYSNNTDVGTDNNVIATYRVNATWSGVDLTSHKVVRES